MQTAAWFPLWLDDHSCTHPGRWNSATQGMQFPWPGFLPSEQNVVKVLNSSSEATIIVSKSCPIISPISHMVNAETIGEHLICNKKTLKLPLELRGSQEMDSSDGRSPQLSHS